MIIHVPGLSPGTSSIISPLNYMRDYIRQNPLRCLGVFSNASKREIVSNEIKIKAFLKVKRTVSFPSDSIAGLEAPDRTPEVIVKAQKTLELPKDRLKAQLFWFVRITEEDNKALEYLMAGHPDETLAIWERSDSFSSMLNRMTLGLLTWNLQSLILNAVRLFSDKAKAAQVCALAGETVNMDGTELMKLYIDTIRENDPEMLPILLDAIEYGGFYMQVAYTPGFVWKHLIKHAIIGPKIDDVENRLAAIAATDPADKTGRARLADDMLSETDLNAIEEVLGTDCPEIIDLRQRMASTALEAFIQRYNASYIGYLIVGEVYNQIQKAESVAPPDSPIQLRCQENLDILKRIMSGDDKSDDDTKVSETDGSDSTDSSGDSGSSDNSDTSHSSHSSHSSAGNTRTIPLDEWKRQQRREKIKAAFWLTVILFVPFLIGYLAAGVKGIGGMLIFFACAFVYAVVAPPYNDSARTNLLALLLAAVLATGGYLLIQADKNLEHKRELRYDYEELMMQPTLFRYEMFLFHHGTELKPNIRQQILEDYYALSLDSCLASVNKYSLDYYSPSGIGFLEDFKDKCSDSHYMELTEDKINEIVDSLYNVAENKNTYKGWLDYEAAVSLEHLRDSRRKLEKMEPLWQKESWAWTTACDINEKKYYETYLAHHPYGKHRKEAQARIEKLTPKSQYKNPQGHIVFPAHSRPLTREQIDSVVRQYAISNHLDSVIRENIRSEIEKKDGKD